ncbi:MAG: family 43 glycosylhydrolase [Suipraeoptans sp.]
MKKQAFNPYLPSYEYVPDAEPYVFGDRVYIYGSHDRFNGNEYCMNNYVCWSAPVDDMGNWSYEGVIYDKVKDPMCDNPEKRLLFAPDVQQGADGRYYLYYAFDFMGVMAVAVSNTPAGEYEFYGYVHYKDGTLLGKKDGDAFQFDPGVLVDDDGRVFLYSGFCPMTTKMFQYLGFPEPIIKGGMVIELETDMLTVKQEPKVIFPWGANGKGTSFEGHEFFEASSIRKIGCKYYFVYSSINGHELCYAISNKPDGDFIYGGTIISNGDIYLDGRTSENALNYTGNNHGSIVEINEQWYVFYHRQTNRHQFSRQVCAEKIIIENDGTIKQVEMTSCGLNYGPLVGSGSYDARVVCNLISRFGAITYGFGVAMEEYHPYLTQDGADREDNPNQYIANMTESAVAGFKYFELKKLKAIVITVRGTGKGIMEVSSVLKGSPAAAIVVDASSGWKEYSSDIQLPDGITDLYFTYHGEGYIDFLSFELKIN